MYTKDKAKEMEKYLNKRKSGKSKPMKAYKMSEELGRGYEAIEMKKGKKK